MTMNAKGEIIFSLSDFLEHMSDEIKADLIKVLACQDSVIKDVADQIIDGMTEDGSFGGLFCTASDSPRSGLDYAKRRWAKESGTVAKTEIERLERALKRSEEDRARLNLQLIERRYS